MSKTTITTGELAQILWRAAEGWTAQTAAITLLAAHGTWIPRLTGHPDLLLIDDDEGEPYPYGIDWHKVAAALAAGQLPGSSSELRILAIAASLGDSDVPVRLGDAVTGLDGTNLGLVLQAIATANGRPWAT
ncbi:hypothetical protein NLX86_31795 [Streptomyces sp. A3M-1-3]|uniref:hypothetical protein n=1 Tax=Streptomyces sp. A3M-1-3 TaxID=2962044 RepID=UPI0020B86F71|nr:hypothetical protein [Streptomyces sp. A3M-1-3]MCP3822506.1 hypothetical protein [Streptomyces sp. A3M-1-3]